MMEPTAWAKEQFGNVDLGDSRRTSRLVRIAASAAAFPAGTVTKVFAEDAERQGAYDFLESPHIQADALEQGVGQMVAARCASEERIFVAVDGSSLSFVDREGARGLGAIGSYAAGGLGLKVISALALNSSGVPIGLLRQVFWRRPVHRPTNRRPSSERPIDKKETKHWLDAVLKSGERIRSASGAPEITFLIDREGDSAAMLSTLVGTGHRFVVRGNWDRVVASDDGRPWKLRNLIAHQKVLGSYEIELPAGPGRAARTAKVSLRVANIILPLKDPVTGRKIGIHLSAVNAREMIDRPAGDEALDWLLLTNAKVTTFKGARAIVSNYTLRWRIEEFHRAWKSGHCNVEQSQLRSEEALRKWALVLAAVACRVERLKLLARETPELAADAEFSEVELHALILLKRRSKKKTEVIPDTVPSIGQATRWLAELGGYTGKSSGGPPGAITISRGLFKLRAAADAIAAFLAKDDDENR
jgi:Transposase DNA-binding/Transposase Tn5 dimerisation domain